MEFDNFTERARGFIQSAQTLALRSNHQQLTSLHLLECLLEDTDGLADKLINAAGGDAKQALINTEAELKKLPKVEGTGAPQTYLARKRRGCSSRPRKSLRNRATASSPPRSCC